LFQRWLFWPLFTMVMGFALGGSFVSAFLYNDPSSNHGPSVLWQKLWTDPNATFAGAVAVFTLALVIVGAWQARRLRQTVEATEKAVAETRRIGEAEVRAYVHIKSAAVGFMRFGPTMPFVQFLASNSGQSPARNFLWNIMFQYPAEPASRQSTLNHRI
jgi:hypothetical protein